MCRETTRRGLTSKGHHILGGVPVHPRVLKHGTEDLVVVESTRIQRQRAKRREGGVRGARGQRREFNLLRASSLERGHSASRCRQRRQWTGSCRDHTYQKSTCDGKKKRRERGCGVGKLRYHERGDGKLVSLHRAQSEF
jgi:hypothetical protein